MKNFLKDSLPLWVTGVLAILFLVFMPQDAHQPGVAVNAGDNVKKIVLKVLVG